MARIEQITANPFHLPLKDTLKWGQGHQLASLEHVLVTVTLCDGTIGQAEATPRPTIYGETQVSICHIINQHLAPLLVDCEVDTREDIDALEPTLHYIRGNHTAKGAINMALHAALAESNGQPLTSWLGTQMSGTQVSYIVSTGTIDDVLADVDMIYEQGVRVFKVKIGMNLPQEIETLLQLISTFPQAAFYVDANQCLTPDTALPTLNRLYDMGVMYCEEPLPIHQVLARQMLHQQTAMPIIGDDSCFTLEDVQREIALDTFDIVNIKTARTGFSQSMRIAHLARDYGKQVMVGSQASSWMGCRHAALFAMAINSDCATEATFFLKTESNELLPTIEEGYLKVR